MMGKILIPDLDDRVIDTLRLKASIRGHSLEQELRRIVMDAAKLTPAEKVAVADAICAKTPPVPQTDSTLLIREDRDR